MSADATAPVPSVECTDLVVRYGSVTAVDGLTLDARAGEVLALLGPNGAGKTSTVETLEGYRRPDAGRLRVLGLDPVADHRALAPRVGVMLQRGGLYPMLGPRRALRLFAAYYAEAENPEELLALVALEKVADTPWRHLSGGEQQRLSLALALVGRPEVVFLDEPTAGVDPEGRLVVRAVVTDLARKGTCVVLTTHELAEAERLADRVVIIKDGRRVASGSPTELAGEPTLRFGAPAGLDLQALGVVLGAPVDEVAPGRYQIGVPATPALTAALTAWLAERGAALSDLRTARSLEETYLDIVGQVGRDDPPGRRGRPR